MLWVLEKIVFQTKDVVGTQKNYFPNKTYVVGTQKNYFPNKTYVMGTQKNYFPNKTCCGYSKKQLLNETVLLSTQNTCLN